MNGARRGSNNLLVGGPEATKSGEPFGQAKRLYWNARNGAFHHVSHAAGPFANRMRSL